MITIDQIVKKYQLEKSRAKKVQVLKTSSLNLHHVTGLTGIPKMHIIEIYGPPGSGKTTLANCIMRAGQKRDDRPALYVDVEDKYDRQYALACGINLSKSSFLYKIPENGEEACDLYTDGVKSGAFSVIVLDSVGSLTFKAELEGNLGDANMGVRARLIGKFIRRVTVAKKLSNSVLILLNQVRDNIGGGKFAPEKSTGGWTLQHNIALRLRTGRGLAIDSQKHGFYINVTCKKNSLGMEGRRVEIPLVYYKGIYLPVELLLTAKRYGLIKAGGGYYKIKVGNSWETLGQGLMNSSRSLKPYGKKLIEDLVLLMEKESKKQRMEIIED